VAIKGVATTIVGKVIVAKNPCYHLGDIRVLKAIKVPALEHLEEAIIFPVNGKRPHSSEIAGSDLDGDMYFVSWDKELIPPKTVAPCAYTAASTPSKQNISQSDLINNFVGYNPFTVGKIHRYFNMWADRKGVNSMECVQLSELFARAIDAAKTGEEVRVCN
jgi:RNA-dependent RNA polymerase